MHSVRDLDCELVFIQSFKDAPRRQRICSSRSRQDAVLATSVWPIVHVIRRPEVLGASVDQFQPARLHNTYFVGYQPRERLFPNLQLSACISDALRRRRQDGQLGRSVVPVSLSLGRRLMTLRLLLALVLFPCAQDKCEGRCTRLWTWRDSLAWPILRQACVSVHQRDSGQVARSLCGRLHAAQDRPGD